MSYFTIGHGGHPEGEPLHLHIWHLIWGFPLFHIWEL